jgi:L-asparaginase II
MSVLPVPGFSRLDIAVKRRDKATAMTDALTDADPILVEVTRGPLVESAHRGALAVCDAKGNTVLALGDVSRDVYPRSAFKMMQALPLVASGAAEAFALTQEELALACASHSGEPMHTAAVGAWLEKIGAAESDLACGPHLPYDEPVAHAMVRARERPTRLHNNCSGKHTGFLTLAKHLGAPFAGYVELDHPVQRAVKGALARLCSRDAQTMPWGIDGCAAPNFAMSLTELATGFARLATGEGLDADEARAAATLQVAVRTKPLYMSGTGRACARLIEAAKAGTTVKTGAEGVFTAAIPGLGLGVALKAADGASRASETIIAGVLASLGVLDPDGETGQSFLAAPVKNWRGDVVGERRPAPALRELLNRVLVA